MVLISSDYIGPSYVLFAQLLSQSSRFIVMSHIIMGPTRTIDSKSVHLFTQVKLPIFACRGCYNKSNYIFALCMGLNKKYFLTLIA